MQVIAEIVGGLVLIGLVLVGADIVVKRLTTKQRR